MEAVLPGQQCRGGGAPMYPPRRDLGAGEGGSPHTTRDTAVDAVIIAAVEDEPNHAPQRRATLLSSLERTGVSRENSDVLPLRELVRRGVERVGSAGGGDRYGLGGLAERGEGPSENTPSK